MKRRQIITDPKVIAGELAFSFDKNSSDKHFNDEFFKKKNNVKKPYYK